ncbi:MAG: DUF4249 domain-containing protein, partial [Bacteroidetes bacterium]|nr:DUF4249 domain-containing protein [Bacteroidota bacterium]
MSKVYYIGLLITLFSCQREVEIEWPVPKPELIIHCIFSSENSFTVELSQPVSISDTTFQFVDDATVDIFENENLFESLVPQDFGKYLGTKAPQPGLTYSVKVEHPNFPTLSATSYIPIMIKPSRIELIDTAGIHEWGKPFSQFNISFSDPDDLANYYEVVAYSIDPQDNRISSIIWPYSVTDPILTSEEILESDPGSFVFSDNLINGKDYTVQVPIELITKWSFGIVRFQFISASEEYFRFKKSLIKHE